MEIFRATRADDDLFAGFTCCEAGAPAWQQEVENFLRGSALRRAEHVVGLRDGQTLVAAAAFDSRAIELVPMNNPLPEPGWHLHAAGTSLDLQRQGHCNSLLVATFEMMKSINPLRRAVTGNIHKDNEASIKACEKAGLERLAPLDDNYWIHFGYLG